VSGQYRFLTIVLLVLVYGFQVEAIAQWQISELDIDFGNPIPSAIGYDDDNNPMITFRNGTNLYFTRWEEDRWIEPQSIRGGVLFSKFIHSENETFLIDFSQRNNQYVFRVYDALNRPFVRQIYESNGMAACNSWDAAIDSDGKVHFVGTRSSAIFYGYYSPDGNENVIPIIQSQVDLYNASLAVDSENDPHIIYFSNNLTLRHAFSEDNEFLSRTVDEGRFSNTSIVIDVNDLITVTYYDTENQNLKSASVEWR
jgi:hypothetical protein